MVRPHKRIGNSNRDSAAGVSVVVPTLNEQDNVQQLVARLAAALKGQPYEIIFIDDHSSDATYERIAALTGDYPIRVRLKEGTPGKAYSLVQGFKLARYDLLAMIDADLQYPPEALPEMIAKIRDDEADVVVANRREKKTRFIRNLLSEGFDLLFARLLWRFDVDVQSGEKVFRKEVVERIDPNPKSPWTLDLQLLASARSGGYRLAGHDITYDVRFSGEEKVSKLRTSIEIGFQTLALRMHAPHFVPFHRRTQSQEGHGFHFRGTKYIAHTTLGRRDLALERTTLLQRLVLGAGLTVVVAGFIVDWHAALVVLVSLVTLLYFTDLSFNLYLIVRSFYQYSEISVGNVLLEKRSEWPRYTIFCPLYKEAQIIPQFTEAMAKMDYPKDKLEIMLLL
jgi:cellulose synthase/poly-beta-1,6-N-acetylglucosamine synthase-like glycosyltransferase